MSSVLVLVLGGPDAAEAESTALAARQQACARPFEVRVIPAAVAPGLAIEAAILRSDAEVIALLDAAGPPGAGWLSALVAALDEDPTVGAAAAVGSPAVGSPAVGPAAEADSPTPAAAGKISIGDGEEEHARLAARPDELCRLPTAGCAVRREAWDEARFDPRAPAGELGPRLARALLETGWAIAEVPAARIVRAGPPPPRPRWAPVIFSSPTPTLEAAAGSPLTRLAKLARTAARAAEVLRDGGVGGFLQQLRVRSQAERPWHEQLPWSLLASPRPARLPPRAGAVSGPLSINWVVPAFFAGSGGHMTIFRLVRRLEERGHKCRIVFTSTEGLLPTEGVRLRALVHRHFQPIRARCLAFTGQALPDADVHVATHWDTAVVVDRRRRSGAGAYLVQDWEPSFYPAGTRAAVAESTYGLGLQHLTAGPWLAGKLEARGAAAVPFELAVDSADYFVESGLNPPAQGRLAVYLRPLTERRGFEVVALALAEVARLRPALEIVAYGTAPAELSLPFAARKAGVLSTAQLRRLYCESTVGLSCSLTNHSLVPQEMWACGLPVIEIDGESTRAVYRDGEDVVLAPLEPLALAARIVSLLDDQALRSKLREGGLARAARLDWGRSAAQVEAGLRAAVALSLEGNKR